MLWLMRLALLAPRGTLLLTGLLTVGALWYTSSTLEFETSRHALVSSSSQALQMEQVLNDEFPSIDYLVVVVEPPSWERGRQFVEALASRLRTDLQHINQVIEKVDTASLHGKQLLYLSFEELRLLKQRLETAQVFLHTLSVAPGLVSLLTAIRQQLRQTLAANVSRVLLRPSSLPNLYPQGGDMDVTFLRALFMAIALAIEAPGTFSSPWSDFFSHKNKEAWWAEERYLTSKHQRFFFVLIDDRTPIHGLAKEAASLRTVRAQLRALRGDFPDIQAGVTGGRALKTDEMLTARHDMFAATVIALVGAVFIFIVIFQQLWHSLCVIVTLLVGLCWTLGFTTLMIGHLNILSATFLPLLIGLGIDFGIHLVTRYGEERARQANFATAMETTYRHTGPGVVIAALTTALAFYSVALTGFRGLQEVGCIAGSGLLLCLLASYTVLPACLALHKQSGHAPSGLWRPFQHPSSPLLCRFPRTLLSGIAGMTLAGIILLPMPRFDYNLLNLQAHGAESVIWEYRLFEEAGRSSWYALSLADSRDELYEKVAQFTALSSVSHVASLASIVPEQQTARRFLVKLLAPYLADITAPWGAMTPIDLASISRELQSIHFYLRRFKDVNTTRPVWRRAPIQGVVEAPEALPASPAASSAWQAAYEALLKIQHALRTRPRQEIQHALTIFQNQLIDDIKSRLDFLQQNMNPTPITIDDVPNHLRQRFVSTRGRFLLQIFPRDNIWERQAMHTFVTQLQTVDPAITGAPVMAWQSIQQLQRGYTRGGAYAFLAICITILALFRCLKSTLLALTPVLFGGLWTMACMALLHVQVNMANLMILPLFLGMAVDHGIHLVHRLLEEPQNAVLPWNHSTGKAIVLSSLTTVVGFGSLMVARHQGIFSLGVLATIAVTCSLIATFGILPIIFQIFYIRKL